MGDLRIGDATTVVIGRGVATASQVLGDHPARIVALVTQPGPASRLASEIHAGLDATATLIEVPDGEGAKTLATVEAVCERFASTGITRSDLVVGVGGGALTDLVGFAAAIYLRGVDVRYVTTTLLGAVDAAIGGKTGVNAGGKNLIGAFRHPQLVVVDLDVLDALPDDLRRQGMAEALKAGLIADPGLVDLLERDGLGASLDAVVPAAMKVKADVVGRDFREVGERAILNYGHTVGHAVEHAAAVPHGDAVAIGMVAAGRASALVAGFEEEERQRGVIEALGLPTEAPSVDGDAVYRLLQRDKKRASERLTMVLLEAVGRPVITEVDGATVRAALAAVGVQGDFT